MKIWIKYFIIGWSIINVGILIVSFQIMKSEFIKTSIGVKLQKTEAPSPGALLSGSAREKSLFKTSESSISKEEFLNRVKNEKGIIIDRKEKVSKLIYILLPLYAFTIWAIPVFVFSLLGISSDPMNDVHTDLIMNHLLQFDGQSENSGRNGGEERGQEVVVSLEGRPGKGQMKLFLVILSGFLLLAYSPARGADWKYCGQTPNASYFYNSRSMVRQENIVKVWMEAVYSGKGRLKEAEKLGGEDRNLTNSIALEEIDSKDQRNRVLTVTVYSMEGKVIISDSKELEQDFLVPEAILESFYKRWSNKG